MSQIIAIFQWIMGHGPEVINAALVVFGSLLTVFTSLAALFMVIPGAQPEGFFQRGVDILQKIVNFIAKYSRK